MSERVIAKGYQINHVIVIGDQQERREGEIGLWWRVQCVYQDPKKGVCGKIFFVKPCKLDPLRPVQSCGCMAKSDSYKKQRKTVFYKGAIRR